MKKIDGLKTIQALAQHHSQILKTKLHEVCLVLIEEVLYTLSSLFLCFHLCGSCIFIRQHVSVSVHATVFLLIQYSYYTGEKHTLCSGVCSYEHRS